MLAAADYLEVFASVAVLVATRAHLIALMVLATDAMAAHHDRIDTLGLLEEVGDEARAAPVLITARRIQRDNDLALALDALLTGGD